MPASRRGRLAPTPTGLLHVGHARTFAVAAERAGSAGLVMRIEDLDGPRCRPEYTAAALEDLRWLGLDWTEGPDLGGPLGPYTQSERTAWYLEIWRQLEATGLIYPSPHSRRDVEAAATAPHDTTHDTTHATPTRATPFIEAPRREPAGRRAVGREPPPEANTNPPPPEAPRRATNNPSGLQPAPPAPAEPIFPPALRPARWDRAAAPGGFPWRFRVPDGRVIEFHDELCGTVRRTAGVDFGDFVIWRRDDLAAYELAVVADDHAMEIAEVVRGEDLLTSTARQLLLYEALGWQPPAFAHAPLVCDAAGHRLAKRSGGLAIRGLRDAGWTPNEVLKATLPSHPT
jgi:glutamyl/glutaminyl-tRNA synthetase